MLLVALAISGALSGCRDATLPGPASVDSADEIDLIVVAGAGAAYVWASRPLASGESVEALRTEWEVVGTEGNSWQDSEAASAYRVVHGDTSLAEANPRTIGATLLADQRLLAADRSLTLRLAVDAPSEGPQWAVRLHREAASGGEAWLDLCGENDWLADKPDPCADVSAALIAAASTVPEQVIFSLSVVPVDFPDLELATSGQVIIETGRRDAWGDLHAHSNLSHDGCEDEDADCLPRHEVPAADFFAEAEARYLDFAALTDHSEYSRWTRSDTGGAEDIWSTARAAVRNHAGSTLPILGYEWTGDYGTGGHRTVLFDDDAVCAAYRATALPGIADRERVSGVEHYFADVDARVAQTPSALTAALAAAPEAESCDEVGVIGFFHHPAMGRPAAVDWEDVENQVPGDALVEIYSEHGSSECADLDALGCDWGLNEERYRASGSVQNALQAGLALGFVAGTDSHDALPGSLEDGPGPVEAGDFVDTQLHPGGLTLAWVPPVALDRPTLFDALGQRHTAGASTRVEGLAVAATDTSGAVYLPGDAVPALPLNVWIQADEALVGVAELVDAEGEIVATTDISGTSVMFPAALTGPSYLRLRLEVEGTDQRVWASPFFPGDR